MGRSLCATLAIILDTNRFPWLGCCNYYGSLENLILVKVLDSQPHEAATRQFERPLLQSLQPMGLDSSLRTFESTTCVAESGIAKQPDCQYSPKETFIKLERINGPHLW
ncbi:hypothetical protein N7497_003270 [Penicillium chrysogenum]|uniref:Uncharacterized protein n=1 Tax=Penicillium chrysogenum TaxID=5076 RepID=A0ABQ8WD40_PENCH|nr:hypothetical protein N7505_008246 [Penicillium chrysogenum]KAJ5272148.1 hypothetical protein N7524_005417 [Penicillium chrysogenum]KAJ6163291.1 hypothetical protein N7497_003270 [Penicillium chrysogenum]